MKTYKELREASWDARIDSYVVAEIKKRKLAKVVVNATDDTKMTLPPNKPKFKFPMDRGSGIISVYLKKMPSSIAVAFNYRVEVK